MSLEYLTKLSNYFNGKQQHWNCFLFLLMDWNKYFVDEYLSELQVAE